MATGHAYWFRPKRYGYGAEPSNWKGWLATGAFIAFAVAVSFWLLDWPATGGGEFVWTNVLTWIALLGTATGAFIWLCWQKTDGEWRWRWGK